MSDQLSPTEKPAPAPRRRGVLFIAAIAVGAALAGAVATTAISASGFGPRHGFGPGFGMGHGFGPGHWRQGGIMNVDPAVIEDRADRAIRHLAIELDATPDQQEKLRGIAKAAVKDLAPMREKVQSAQRARALLTQQSIDRAAVEALRAEQIALADAASKRVTQALIDAAEVLTPEQRRKIDERLNERRGYWGIGRRG